MLNHDRFRELSALATIGQLSSDEDRELNDHLKDCITCRDAQQDYSRIILHELPRTDAAFRRTRAATFVPFLNADLRDRFLARARAAGANFSREAERPLGFGFPTPRWIWGWRSVLAVTTFAMVIFTGLMIVGRHRLGLRSRILNAASVQQVRETHNLPAEVVIPHLSTEPDPGELSHMRKSLALSRKLVRDLQTRLEQAQGQTTRLSAELQRVEADNVAFATADQQKDTVIADLRAQNEKLDRQEADNLSGLLIKEERIQDLADSLDQETADLERERQLTGVTKDVRQLMGARNLHIIDVHDVDGNSRAAKAFGRVFYAEGQSLIFYAFDLPNGKMSPTRYTFHAWGQSEARPQEARNLGSFDVDDHDQRRWVLKVNDPKLLTGIDSVFVTAESLGDPTEPHGKKLMYAYIVGQPNHP